MIQKTFVCILMLLLSGWTFVSAQELPCLLIQGHALLEQNKTEEAVACFEKVLTLDNRNYDALVFLCNYHFLSGEKQLNKIEKAYLANEDPTRMQVAQYMEDLKSIYETYYVKAEKYLIQSYLLRRNDHLDELAGKIAEFKERIGIKLPGNKKPWFKQIRLP